LWRTDLASRTTPLGYRLRLNGYAPTNFSSRPGAAARDRQLQGNPIGTSEH
jgi:hypothetical protein